MSATLLPRHLLSAALVTPQPGITHWQGLGMFGIDLSILVVIVALAFRSSRWWPIILAGLQLDVVLVHLIHFIAPHATMPSAYRSATELWIYPMLVVLLLGTWRHRNREEAYGNDPPWKP